MFSGCRCIPYSGPSSTQCNSVVHLLNFKCPLVVIRREKQSPTSVLATDPGTSKRRYHEYVRTTLSLYIYISLERQTAELPPQKNATKKWTLKTSHPPLDPPPTAKPPPCSGPARIETAGRRSTIIQTFFQQRHSSGGSRLPPKRLNNAFSWQRGSAVAATQIYRCLLLPPPPPRDIPPCERFPRLTQPFQAGRMPSPSAQSHGTTACCGKI